MYSVTGRCFEEPLAELLNLLSRRLGSLTITAEFNDPIMLGLPCKKANEAFLGHWEFPVLLPSPLTTVADVCHQSLKHVQLREKRILYFPNIIEIGVTLSSSCSIHDGSSVA